MIVLIFLAAVCCIQNFDFDKLQLFELNADGLVFRQNTKDYAKVSKVWNQKRKESHPLAVFVPQSIEDVSNAVAFANENKLHILVKAGGHSFGGFSQANDAFVVYMKELNSIYIDRDNLIMTVGAGALLKDIYKTIDGTNLLFVAGTCPTVGIAGFTLGGGIGPFSRSYGLAADNLIEASVVLNNGTLIVASETQNEDLFWALRGAGHNSLGIVVEFKFRLHYVSGRCHPYGRIDFVCLSQSCANEVLHGFSTESLKFDDRITIDITSTLKTISVYYFFKDYSEDDANEILENILVDLPKAAFHLREYGTPQEYVNRSLKSFIYQFYPLPTRSYCKSMFLNHLTFDELDLVTRKMYELPFLKGVIGLGISLLGGAIQEKASNYTSFYHRDSKFKVLITIQWYYSKDDLFSIEYLTSIFECFRNNTRQYANYEDEYLPANEYPKRYWGKNVDRLLHIKQKYDKQDVFHFPQSIPAP